MTAPVLTRDGRWGKAQRSGGVWTSTTIWCGYRTLEEAFAACEGWDDLQPWDRHGGYPGLPVSEGKDVSDDSCG